MPFSEITALDSNSLSPIMLATLKHKDLITFSSFLKRYSTTLIISLLVHLFGRNLNSRCREKSHETWSWLYEWWGIVAMPETSSNSLQYELSNSGAILDVMNEYPKYVSKSSQTVTDWTCRLENDWLKEWLSVIFQYYKNSSK